jgi:hypothetical protein
MRFTQLIAGVRAGSLQGFADGSATENFNSH